MFVIAVLPSVALSETFDAGSAFRKHHQGYLSWACGMVHNLVKTDSRPAERIIAKLIDSAQQGKNAHSAKDSGLDNEKADEIESLTLDFGLSDSNDNMLNDGPEAAFNQSASPESGSLDIGVDLGESPSEASIDDTQRSEKAAEEEGEEEEEEEIDDTSNDVFNLGIGGN